MPQPLRPGRDPNHPEDRTLVAVDIDGFGRQARTNLIRVKLRRRLDGWCGGVLTRAQASKEQWVAQDTGDGFIFSIDAHVPRDVLLGKFLAGLPQRLTRHNRDRPEAERIRLRLAMHAGDVLRDPDPIHGEATVLVCRLLDAEELRACLKATEQPLAAIVSQTIYDNIIKQAYPPIDPLEWERVITATKEGARQAWVHVPSDPDAPRRAGVVAVDRRHST